MEPYVFPGGTAVVTGAASGIGEALAHGLAARGSHLALLDRDADGLSAVAGALVRQHPGLRVSTHVVDLADRAATGRAAAAVLADHERLTLLVNNASTALVGRFDETSLEQFFALLDVNVRAVVQLTHLLLPALKASPGSHLVNVSSAFGLLATPRQSAYATSKFAVRGFTEVLRAELPPAGVGVTSVHPGGTRTRLAQHASAGAGVSPPQARVQLGVFDRVLTLSPAHVAEAVLDAVEHRRGRVLVGVTAKVPDALARLFPGSYPAAMALAERVTGAALGRWATGGRGR